MIEISDRFPRLLETIPTMVPSVKQLSASLNIFSCLLCISMRSFDDRCGLLTVAYTDTA
jgi:hypothetical protein